MIYNKFIIITIVVIYLPTPSVDKVACAQQARVVGQQANELRYQLSSPQIQQYSYICIYSNIYTQVNSGKYRNMIELMSLYTVCVHE